MPHFYPHPLAITQSCNPDLTANEAEDEVVLHPPQLLYRNTDSFKILIQIVLILGNTIPRQLSIKHESRIKKCSDMHELRRLSNNVNKEVSNG